MALACILYTPILLLVSACTQTSPPSSGPSSTSIANVSAVKIARAMVEHHVIRLRPGQDLKAELLAFAEEHEVDAGWIVTCVGSLTQYALRFANVDEGSTGSGHFEIVSLTGTLARSGAHLHMSVSDSEGRTTGGHVLDGNVVYTTAELVIAVDHAKRFDREVDSTYGYRELIVWPQ